MNRGVLLMLLAGGLGLAYLVYDWMQYRMRRRRSREVQETGMAAKVSYDLSLIHISEPTRPY